MKYLLGIYLAVTVVMSLVAFVVYGFDKRRARNDGRRVPEKTLHLLALLGGWPGALAGQKVFRHKTQKLNFLIVFWSIVALHLTALAAAVYCWWNWA